MVMEEISNEETSGSSDSVLPLPKRMKATVVTTINPTLSNTVTKTKYKGVVQQKNGRWGAQIYAGHDRIWLGTFKSAHEAAAAYNSASIKVLSFDPNSHRNFPWSDATVHEPDFQECYTKDVVLNMIRDGSYPQKFKDFLRIRSQILNIVESKQVRGGDRGGESNKYVSCTQLFHKELTPSDVGKLNRLVIPKKFAVKYLPVVNNEHNEREEDEIAGDVEVVFYDRAMRQWKFKYCYWRSSQSFVFTRGWNGFVKEKNLKEKDVIVFYTCNVPNHGGRSKNFLMIDIHSGNSIVVPKEVNMVRESSDEELKTKDLFSSKLEVEETKSKENKGGFMLFGVRIQ